ncbi:metabolite traffic protein EboE [Streptomyces sp. Inha503]|uniref:metabolite traffic protein EboE n=1 Tax=Streptomyces sp. Inha503 TaxID=3383314 RepID=UPI0039A3DCA9
MRLYHRDGTTIHLAYCTNVLPAEDLDGIVRQLDVIGEPVRQRLEVPLLGLGLWLARDIAHALVNDRCALTRLRQELEARGLEVVTLNAFPYRGFQQPVVKHAVYTPDWADPSRAAYTLDTARVLSALLPDDAAHGSVSTLPLGWRTGWTPERHHTARRHLSRLAEELARLAASEGRVIRVGLEPEPGCVLSTIGDAPGLLDALDSAWLGVCVDTCHLAVDFEPPALALRELSAAGVPVVKAQLSAALQADDPLDAETRRALELFDEPRFLHQTRAGHLDPTRRRRWDDLGDALRHPTGRDPDPPGPWRVHYHVPLHADPQPPLTATRRVLTEAVHALAGGPRPATDHLEVETYTWSVLPPSVRPASDHALATAIAGELAWARTELLRAGLLEHPPATRTTPLTDPDAARRAVGEEAP